MTRTVLALSLALSLAACGGGSSGGGGEPGGGGSSGGEATYAGPIASTDVAHGETRFTAVCSSCHTGGLPAEVSGWTPERMRRQIREGSGEMPAIGTARLADADLEALLAYLASTGAVAGDAAPAGEASGTTAP